MQHSTLLIAALSLFTCLASGFLNATTTWAADTLQFNRDVRPILSDHCFSCHGFDSKKREADLRLDTAEGAFAKREGDPAIVPGNPDASSIWKRIVSTNPDERMPPPQAHKDLNDQQREILRRWIQEGAAYEGHWAFVAPTKPAVPATAAHPVDAFLKARLNETGLAATARAEPAVLLRRLAFTLTGLPPTREEVAEFTADPSPTKYAAFVEKYLASPRYGEEQARYWLDVARYADTHGLHLDNERQMWAYRDWVIHAFNDNLPFDQFTRWQLAGDLLPEPTPEQLIATGFNRCNVTTSEGGALDDEFRYRYAVDRASTTIETWLGLTGGCAVCHDHKYDPLTTKEFYQLYAFFNQAADPPMDRNVANTDPFIQLYRPEQSAKLRELQTREAATLEALRESAAHVAYEEPTAENTPEQIVTDVLLDDQFPYGAGIRTTSRNPSVWENQDTFAPKFGIRSLYQASSYFLEDDVDFNTSPVEIPDDAAVEAWVYPDPNAPPAVIALVLKQGGEKVAHWGDPEIGNFGIGRGNKSLHLGPIPTPVAGID